jgi:hypothetical protein
MKKFLLLIFITVYGKVWAQQEGTFYFMNTISQSTYYNPAFTPKYNTTIGFPGLASNYVMGHNSGFAYRDLITRREDDSLIVTLDKFYNRLKDQNHARAQAMTDLFHLSFRLNPHMQFTLNSTVKNLVHFQYPKNIANLLVNGNVPFIGENTNIALDLMSLGYIESGLGLNYRINSIWTIGTRLKLLNGYANIHTDRAAIAVNMTDVNHIEITGDALIRTAGAPAYLDDDDDINGFSDVKTMLGNYGYGIDLGIAVKPVERLTLGLSMVDIGGIKWKKSVRDYMLDPSVASYTFKGLDIQRIINDDENYESGLDSLEDKFKFQETVGRSYRSTLPLKLYFSCSYELARNLYTNLLLAGEKNTGLTEYYGTVNITKNIGKALTLSVSYTNSRTYYQNWGAGISFNLAPFQLYVVGDSMMGAATYGFSNREVTDYLYGLQYFNLRFGLNFIGRWEKTTQKLSDDRLH